LVSLPVLLVALAPLDGVVVPLALACVPAVEVSPETVPDCVVPVVPLSFEAVRVFLLLLLQPKINAAASVSPYAYFMWCLLKGFRGASIVGGRRTTRREVPGC